jgi:hypothetical protein
VLTRRQAQSLRTYNRLTLNLPGTVLIDQRFRTDHPPSKTNSGRSRSQSQDSVTLAARRAKPAKKGSSVHADIIDHLDISGIGAASQYSHFYHRIRARSIATLYLPGFHHDGPFDACAPSRNRHRMKAPMLAWAATEGAVDPAGPFPPELVSPVSPDSLTPVKPPKAPSRTSSDYVGMGRLGDALPKKRNDALAEAWGVAEPEPFEEFFAGGGSGHASAASSVRAGHDGGLYFQQRRGRDGKSEQGAERPRAAHRRSTQRAPPPKPIAVPGGDVGYSEGDVQLSPDQTSPGTRRSRSLMQRIRKMRETPNVPVPAQVETSESPSTGEPTPGGGKQSRPSHRPNNSFLGRFSKSPNTPTFDKPPISPFSDKSAVSIEEVGKEKQLPTLPNDGPVSPGSASGNEGYFDQQAGGSDTGQSGIGRRASLMRKMVNGVKRGARA